MYLRALKKAVGYRAILI